MPPSKSKSRKKQSKLKKHKKSGRKASKVLGRRKSNTKKTWENFLRNKDSIKALEKSWKAKNPEEYYRKTIKRLVRKYSSNKK